MRKKELNLYKPIKNLGPPYLTPEEISQFHDQFTLFDSELSVKKLYQAMVAQNISKADKLVIPFMSELKGKETIGFDEYMSEMINYFTKQKLEDVILQILGDAQTGEITKETVKEVLEDSLGREISAVELISIMQELKKEDHELPFFRKKSSEHA